MENTELYENNPAVIHQTHHLAYIGSVALEASNVIEGYSKKIRGLQEAYNKACADASNAALSIQTLNTQLRTLREDAQNSRNQEIESIKSFIDRILSINGKLTETQRENDRYIKQLAALLKENDERTAQVHSLQDSLSEAQENLDALRTKLDDRNASYAILEQSLKLMEDEFEKTKAENKKLKRRVYGDDVVKPKRRVE